VDDNNEIVEYDLSPGAREFKTISPARDALQALELNVVKELGLLYKSIQTLETKAEEDIRTALMVGDEENETLSLAGGVFKLDILKTKGKVLADITKIIQNEDELNFKKQIVNVTKINPPPPPPAIEPPKHERIFVVPVYEEVITADGRRVVQKVEQDSQYREVKLND
jgi:hypothetical protein